MTASPIVLEAPMPFRPDQPTAHNPLADYFFQQLTEEADPRSLEGKAHMATLAAPLIDKVPAPTFEN